MLIMGCDYHPSVQPIVWLDGRLGKVARGGCRWFERLLDELGFELWVGDAAEIRATRVRKQRNDRFDAQHILKLLMEDRFPRSGRRVRRIEMRGIREMEVLIQNAESVSLSMLGPGR